MDLKQLRTFRAVAELGSLSKAADRLRSAQPALSRHIKLLEHELRVEWILETHAHADHLSAARHLKPLVGGRIAIGENIRTVRAGTSTTKAPVPACGSMRLTRTCRAWQWQM